MTAFLVLFGLPFLLGATWLALWIIRGFIIADESGLRWRKVRTTHFATWPQVNDYYDETIRHKNAIIKTEVGNLKISHATMTNIAALREAISARATNAPTREWAVSGTRAETDWPRTFIYNPAERIAADRFFCAAAIVWFFGFVWLFVKSWQGWGELWEYSAVLTIISAVLYFVWTIGYPFMSWISWLSVREIRSRQAQKITVSQSGLVFEEGTQRIECAWHEITDFYRDPMLATHSGDDRYVVVSTRGNFDFTLLENRWLLCGIIRRHAKNALYQNWRDYRPQQETGAKGERLYTYRTRYNRALMMMPMSVFPIGIIVLLIASQPELRPPETNNWLLGIILGCGFIGSIVFFAVYFWGSIEITDDGITQRGLRGKKFLAWQDVAQLRRNKMDNYEIVGRDARLGFYPAIADVELLREEIARRAIHAEIALSWTENSSH